MKSRVLMVLLLTSLPTGAAGTPSSPEITDGTRDVQLTGISAGVTSVLAPEVDVTAAWFEANDTTVTLRWRVVDLDHRYEPDEALVYWLTGTCGDAIVHFEAKWAYHPGPRGEPRTWAWWGMVTTSAGAAVDHRPAPSSAGDDVVRLDVPRTYLDCDTLKQPYVRALVLHRTGEGTWSGYCTLGGHCDVAPDSGYGRDFRLG